MTFLRDTYTYIYICLYMFKKKLTFSITLWMYSSQSQSRFYSVCNFGDFVKEKTIQGFLVVQWLRINLATQGTSVQSLVQEDRTCCQAAEPVCCVS